MTTFDLDPQGYLPLFRAIGTRLRRIINSRSWRATSSDTCRTQ